MSTTRSLPLLVGGTCVFALSVAQLLTKQQTLGDGIVVQTTHSPLWLGFTSYAALADITSVPPMTFSAGLRSMSAAAITQRIGWGAGSNLSWRRRSHQWPTRVS